MLVMFLGLVVAKVGVAEFKDENRFSPHPQPFSPEVLRGE
jgi:hypothetical protein